MATLEMQRPPRRHSASLAAAPTSPTIIRTPDFIFLPSVPTHEPEDNLPSPMALQHQFALAAQSQAHAHRSSSNSLRAATSSEHSKRTNPASPLSAPASVCQHDADELEEIAEPLSIPDSDLDNQAASLDALRDLRNHHLDSLQSLVHSIAEHHFADAPDAELTQVLDDLFASLRRIGGHNAPLSPTFTRPSLPALGVQYMSDVDRLVLLVDRLTQAAGPATDARHASQLERLNSLTRALVDSDRRMSRTALDSPPQTPGSLAWLAARRASLHQHTLHSPQSSSHISGSRGSWSSVHSSATVATSSDEAALTNGGAPLDAHAKNAALPQPTAWSPRRTELLTEAGLLSTAAPEQQHEVDGSIFDMATIRPSASTRMPPSSSTKPLSIESLYSRQLVTPSAIAPPHSPRSNQASRAASIADRSDSTATATAPALNRKRYSVQTESAASTSLPSYSHDAPTYHHADDDIKQKAYEIDAETSSSDELPGYEAPSSQAAGFAPDVKKQPLETPTLLERRRAKLAAQHSAYAARTPEDLAMVQSSIDRLSSVMPQLHNQRALSPEQQREKQLDHMIGRLAHSNAQRLNDQRSDPPSFRPSRAAPTPPPAAVPPKPVADIKLPLVAAAAAAAEPEPEPELPATPTTPSSLHIAPSTSSSRRSSLLPGAFGRKLSMASIGNALRRASIYDATKLRSREGSESSTASDGKPTTYMARRRAATTDSRSKSDIAEGLTSLFNDGGKTRKGSAGDVSAARLHAQSSFRAIDFADDTPRGRDASLMPRASVEEEDDSMLQDYSFASFDTQASNHRLSVAPSLDSPRSPVSWTASNSSAGSRRSSQLLSSNPATPTWPKSPLTPVSPQATKRHSKAAVTFAADTLASPASGKSTAASLQSQLRDVGFTPLRPGKCLAFAAPPCHVACAPAAPARTESIVCYAVARDTEPPSADAKVSGLAPAASSSSSQSNATDPPVRPASSAAAASAFASTLQPDEVVGVALEFFAEAQPALGTVSVLLWCAHGGASAATVELAFELAAEPGLEASSRRLRVWPLDSNVSLSLCASRESLAGMSSSSGGSGGSGGSERRGAVEVVLPAAVKDGQSGRVGLEMGGSVSRVKLELTEGEVRRGAEESRGEGMVEFPLSARELSACDEGALVCGVCLHSERGKVEPLMAWGEEGRFEWQALPSEGWEELVDAWMCHADQELNRTLTQTAVRFASKIHTQPSPATRAVWVGDTYLVVPASALHPSRVVYQDTSATTRSVACCECGSVLGSATAEGSGTVRLSKYTIELLSASGCRGDTWISTLLSTLQYAAASHGSRRFVLCDSHQARIELETWLFSRAHFTSSLSRHWSHRSHRSQLSTTSAAPNAPSASGASEEWIWKGHRILHRRAQASADEAVERIELPSPVAEWTRAALEACTAVLPSELSNALPGWHTALLATTTKRA